MSLRAALQDVSLGIRVLRTSPGFTVVVVLTLALGIGANTAVFSVMDAMLLRQLPVSNPQELVEFVRLHRRLAKVSMSVLAFEQSPARDGKWTLDIVARRIRTAGKSRRAEERALRCLLAALAHHIARDHRRLLVLDTRREGVSVPAVIDEFLRAAF